MNKEENKNFAEVNNTCYTHTLIYAWLIFIFIWTLIIVCKQFDSKHYLLFHVNCNVTDNFVAQLHVNIFIRITHLEDQFGSRQPYSIVSYHLLYNLLTRNNIQAMAHVYFINVWSLQRRSTRPIVIVRNNNFLLHIIKFLL